MPAPGDQYGGDKIKNPFEEPKVSGFTAQEIATLQSRLNKQLGPEYISSRQGQGGGKVAYLEGNKAIALANEVFGFNGWSSSLGQVQVDYVDENPQNGRINLGLSINVKITLKGGTYHEDIGYGTAENQKSKGAAFEKAKKEAATDGLKRALRTFGNVLGNCLYDKEYLKKVNAMKVKPTKFDENNLYRHPDYAPRIKEAVGIKEEPRRTPMRNHHISRGTTEQSVISSNPDFEDEFGGDQGDLFDGVEICHGEEFTMESLTDETAPKQLEGPKGHHPKDVTNGNNQGSNAGAARQPLPRVQSMPATHPQNGIPQQHQQPNQGSTKPAPPNSRALQTPNGPPNASRPDANRPRGPPATVDVHAIPPKPQSIPNAQPQQIQTPSDSRTTTPAPPLPQPNRAPIGFVTSRAADLMNADSKQALPAFNPHADSPVPMDKRTPGLDHTRSKKIMRQEIQQPTPAPAPANARPGPRNFVNPQNEAGRRIGMPGAAAMSPLANRSAYKSPSIVGVKRPPLADVSNKGGEGGEGPPEEKRQKVDGVGGVENVVS